MIRSLLNHSSDDTRDMSKTTASRKPAKQVDPRAHWTYDDWQLDRYQELTIKQILALWHASHDADYPGMDEWYSDDKNAALNAWEAVTAT